MKIKMLAAALALSSAVSLCQAAPPTTASIETLMQITHAEQLIDRMMTQMEQSLPQMLAASVQGRSLTEAQQRAFDELPPKMMAVLREGMSWEKMRPLMVQVYQEVLTQDEVNQLTAFYRTPGGTALIEKMPLVMQRSLTLTQQLMGPMMQKMQQVAADTMAQAK